VEADLLDTRFAIGLDLLRTDGTDLCLEICERVAEDCFSTGNRNIAPGRDCEYAPAHGTKVCGPVAGPPAHNGRNKRSQQVSVAGQYAKTAALVFGSHGRDIAAVDEDLPWRRYNEMKRAAHHAAAACCLWRSGAG
jgi:hypothetical protein